MQIIQNIESNGFKVRGRHILKRSQRTNKLETCGILNENSFYMFSENVYPYKFGLNYFDTTTLVDCLLYTSPSPRDKRQSRMPSSA